MTEFLQGMFDGLKYGVAAGLIIWFIPYGISKVANMLEHMTK